MTVLLSLSSPFLHGQSSSSCLAAPLTPDSLLSALFIIGSFCVVRLFPMVLAFFSPLLDSEISMYVSLIANAPIHLRRRILDS